MDEQKVIGDYKLTEELGEGAFGKVYKGMKDGDNTIYAVKQISLKNLGQDDNKYLEGEISILKQINGHKNIIKFYNEINDGENKYIVQEFCNGGELEKALEDYKDEHGTPFTEEIVQYLMKQIVDAINFLHNKNILHRDLKLANILLNYDNQDDLKNQNIMKAQIKIIDFGFARKLENGEMAKSILGSPLNMDPKILKEWVNGSSVHNNDFGYDKKVDIWSLGTICYEMLTGERSFTANKKRHLLRKVEKGLYKIPDGIELSREAISFLIGMLQQEYNERLSAKQLKRHFFLRKNVKDFKPFHIEGPLNTRKTNASKLGFNDVDLFDENKGMLEPITEENFGEVEEEEEEEDDEENEIIKDLTQSMSNLTLQDIKLTKEEIFKMLGEMNYSYIISDKLQYSDNIALLKQNPASISMDFEITQQIK